MIAGTFNGWPEAWEYALRGIMKDGKKVPTEYGNRAQMVNGLLLELTGYKEAWHKRDPFCSPNTIAAYKRQFTYDYYREIEERVKAGEKNAKFEYTYFQRFTGFPCIMVMDGKGGWAAIDKNLPFNQLEWVRGELMKGRTDSKRLNIATWIPGMDNFIDSCPCLQRMWFYPHGDYTLDVSITYRSWDWYKGAGSNIVGLMYMVDEHILKGTKFRLGKVIMHGDNVHVYEQDWQQAKEYTLKGSFMDRIKAGAVA
jgi:thymidylate synthase